MPSGILIHLASWPQRTWVENWETVSLLGELGPHLTQCGQAEAYMHATFHLDPPNCFANGRAKTVPNFHDTFAKTFSAYWCDSSLPRT